jgi:predicted nucleotidyltransferase
MEHLHKYTTDITSLCQQYRVCSLYAFGSVLTDRFNNNSDIDLIVEIDESDPIEYAESYFNIKFALEDLLKRPIDLLENKAIRNPLMREHINNSKQLVYAR